MQATPNSGKEESVSGALGFETDAPIQDFPEDQLGRGNFAKALGRIIASYDRPDSLVLALYGEWGIGKTSLLNLAVRAAETESSPKPIIMRFDPWYFSDSENLVRQFFDALRIALGNQDDAERYDKASKLLKNIADGVEALESLPGPGLLAKVLSRLARIAGTSYSNRAEQERSLDRLKENVSTLLRKGRRRVVVVMDDIDRLPASEIRIIVRVIKVLADFQYVTYLLAFDDRVVASALEASEGIDGAQYLEKIVSVAVRVPQVSPGRLVALAAKMLNDFAIAHPKAGWRNASEAQALIGFLSRSCRTIRQLIRLTNAMYVDIQCTDTEVDGLDFAAITALRILTPRVYVFIRDNRDLVIDTDMAHLDRERMDPIAKTQVEGLLQGVPDSEDLRTLLLWLLPKLRRVLSNANYGDSEAQRWRRERRLCDPVSFDTYFQFDLPQGDVSKSRMEMILSHLWDENTLRNEMTSLMDESLDLGLAFLTRLQDHLDDPRVISAAGNVVRVLFDLGDRFPENPRAFPFKFDGETLIMRIVYQVLRRIDREQTRYEHLVTAVNAATESLYPLVVTISVEDGAHGRYATAQGRPAQPNQQLVIDSNLDILEEAARRKIEEWSRGGDGGRLAFHPKLASILFRWAEWGGRQAVSEYILKQLSTPAFARLIIRLSLADQLPDRTPSLAGKHIEALCDPDELMTRIRDIVYGPERAVVDQEAVGVLEKLVATKVPDESEVEASRFTDDVYESQFDAMSDDD